MMWPLKMPVLCDRGRLKIAVRDMHTFKLVLIDQFDSKAELIDANMASAHIPFFLDWKPFAVYRYENRSISWTLLAAGTFLHCPCRPCSV